MEISFNGELDLHHFSPEDTDHLIRSFIDESFSAGITNIRIINGKGRSAKKRRLYAILEADPKVESFCDDGYNWGATLITLSRKDSD